MREIKYHAYLDSEERTILLHMPCGIEKSTLFSKADIQTVLTS